MINRMLDLCRLSGISGCEDAVREHLMELARPFADEMYTDRLGSLHVFRKGERGDKTVMLAAHMDEVGLMVTSVTDEGFLRFDTVGGIDRRVLFAQRVFVGENRVPGVTCMKPQHLVSKDEAKNIPKLTDMIIDIGARSKEEAQKLAAAGDVIVFDDKITMLQNGFIKAKAIDDRLGCAVLSKLIEEKPPVDTWFVFTVQEEVGTRGAYAAAFARNPDYALVVEGTTAADRPDVKGPKRVCVPGNGVVIPYMDRGTIYDRKLFELLKCTAVRENIPWQTKQYISGGTDASAIQRTREGIPVAGIACAVRYIHSPASVVSIADCENMLKLARAFLLQLQ